MCYCCGMKSIKPVIDALSARQRQLGETDAAFARRLGISRSMWQAVRSGEREVGVDTLQRMVNAVPEVYVQVAALFLPDDAALASI